eukprot:m.351333 g.351333  ORF g.351333 m.351333 type:complete len:68 (+) comp16227_c0_seq1:34-237(+)
MREALCLHDLGLTETADSSTCSGSSSGTNSVCTTCNGLLAATAVPDTDSTALHGGLATEAACVGSML